MKVIKIAGLLFLYAFDALLLGLVEKLVKGLIKKLTAWQSAVAQKLGRVNEKRAALQAKR